MECDPSKVEPILDRYPRDESSLIMVLQDIQSEYRYLPCEALEEVAAGLELPLSRVFSAATFYKAFALEPEGRTVVQVCRGTACHVRGAAVLEEELGRLLAVETGGTTGDGRFTLRTVNCVGACAMAPVVITGEDYHPEVRADQLARLVKRAGKKAEVETKAPTRELPVLHRFETGHDLMVRADEARAARARSAGSLQICGGPGCLAAGSKGLVEAFSAAAQRAELSLQVDLTACQHDDRQLQLTGCQGLCQRGPLVHVLPEDTLYCGVKPRDAERIVDAVAGGTVVEELLDDAPTRASHPFYAGQTLQALATCGRVDPESLDDYLAEGGFYGLTRALAVIGPEEVVEMVEASGLRGRGGAGFPTGRKWRSALRAAAKSGHPPYVLCNGDEGDPGAFMDRAIMEGSPFAVLEGMLIGAYALGGREGWIYVRAEYPLAVERLERAIAICRQVGLLGEGILGTTFDFDVRISRGGGAFVCGESSALMKSIEGKTGEPRAKYVRSVESGLRGRPTVLNNVETWSLVPGIVAHDPEWMRGLGTDRSSGTKAFSLTGQVRRTGLVEVPMGTTLRHLIFDIGGGLRDGRTFKAVQTGGPSGGCLPEDQLDLPIDFDALDEAGSMMGSGGMIVMDESTCMVDVARYFVDFLLEESCGKCAPCRLGLPQLSWLLGRVASGTATEADLATIEGIAAGMATNSLCGLGKSAPNPVLSTLRFFRHEYEEHLEGRCDAGVCRELIRYEITQDCTGCLLCLKACPKEAISGAKGELHVIDQEACDKCGICAAICVKHEAVDVVTGGAA